MNIYQFIAKTIELNRISHSYIIRGDDEGTLKAALYLAKGANCLALSERPCGKCSSCRRIDSSNHPDVLITGLDDTGIGIDDIRRLQGEVFARPYEGRRKVNIIRRGERMTIQAQNCLLKILEDPPGAGIIVITVANEMNLLATILSRCQLLKLNVEGEISETKLYQTVLECFLKQDFIEASKELDSLLKDGEKHTEAFLDYLLLQLRDIIVTKVAQKESLLYIKDNSKFAREAAAAYDLDELSRMFSAVSKAREGLRFNVNVRLALEMLVLDIQEV